jgi:hypothetical protein
MAAFCVKLHWHKIKGAASASCAKSTPKEEGGGDTSEGTLLLPPSNCSQYDLLVVQCKNNLGRSVIIITLSARNLVTYKFIFVFN